MDEDLRNRIKAYAEAHHEDARELLRTLAAIPAPTGHEEKRAHFVARWLKEHGAREVFVTRERNAVCVLRSRKPLPRRGIRVFAAHTDIVANDTQALPVEEHDGRMYAPGVGDDTANLVALLMACACLLSHPDLLAQATQNDTLLVVADAGEEGLGNLAGTRGLFFDLSLTRERVKAFYSFDLYIPQLISHAVGSERYRVVVRCQGGHSYQDFGRPSAIAHLCSLIDDFYALELPHDAKTGARTTINVGRIEGGTTVNAIAARASALLEYRSESISNLKTMRAQLMELVERHRTEGVSVTIKTIGRRPGNGDVDANALERITERAASVIRDVANEEPDTAPASTDANIPLSIGVPAITVGATRGALLHTRDEWVDLSSLDEGMRIVLSLMLE